MSKTKEKEEKVLKKKKISVCRNIHDFSDDVFLSLPVDRDLGLPLVATVS